MSYSSQKIIKNSIFLKVEQGAPHTLRLLDADPTEQWQHKIDDKLMNCQGASCLYCNDGHSRSQRFVANVYDHSQQKVLLWSYGPTIGEALAEIETSLKQDQESILNHDLEVSATGSGLQKKTRVQLRLKSKPVPPGLKKIEIKEKETPSVSLEDEFGPPPADDAPWDNLKHK